ncbi:MAG: LPS export ABC transporter periplasmic protein LptC [Acidobacteria bacterium]|nr:LPS export ABC transporter periplasmic protein LptC [Acidobacteriota bacterium]
MRRSSAQRLARWAAGTAIGLSIIVAGVYWQRHNQAKQNQKQAPPIVPPTVEKQLQTYSYSKMDGGRTIFTIRASQATEYKTGERSRLQDVWITIYGRAGKRFDNIHTSECDYLILAGKIRCAGDVQMDLESAEEAKARPGQRVIHVATRNISFDKNSGDVVTEEAVEFRFPYGSGGGRGATYNTREAVFEIHNEVKLTLTSRSAAEHKQPPVELSGASLSFQRNDSTMHLTGPVHVKQGQQQLRAGALVLEFDNNLRARKMSATGRPQFSASDVTVGSSGSPANAQITANEISADFASDGSVSKFFATGNVRGNRKSTTAEDVFSADNAELAMAAGTNQPRLLTARGNVKLDSRGATKSGKAASANRHLETAALQVEFSAADKRASSRRITHAQSLAPATVQWTSGPESTRIRGQEMSADFSVGNRIQWIHGRKGVEVERRNGQDTPQTTTSRELDMAFDKSGFWSEAEFRGTVRYREGERSAEGDRAKMFRNGDRIEIGGSAVVADALSRTVAGSLSINQTTGEIRGDGNVHTSYFARDRNGVADLAPQPAHITAEHFVADKTKGHATYSGKARMWQGDSVIEAGEIEMLRPERRLNARGGVLALFPESVTNNQGKEAKGNSNSKLPAGNGSLWRVRAATLTYLSAEGQALLDENASMQSSQGSLRSKHAEIFLSSSDSGPRQIVRAVAKGDANVQQGDLKGSAEQAEYEALGQKFVLSGGNPTLIDPVRGATSGRKLTFFLSDDRILVESEEGTRTLTRHRVEK